MLWYKRGPELLLKMGTEPFSKIWWFKSNLDQCFSTAGPRPGTGPWHQLYQAVKGSPGICHFSFLSIFHE